MVPHPSWVPAPLSQSPLGTLSSRNPPLLLPPPALAPWAMGLGSSHLSRTPQGAEAVGGSLVAKGGLWSYLQTMISSMFPTHVELWCRLVLSPSLSSWVCRGWRAVQGRDRRQGSGMKQRQAWDTRRLAACGLPGGWAGLRSGLPDTHALQVPTATSSFISACCLSTN